MSGSIAKYAVRGLSAIISIIADSVLAFPTLDTMSTFESGSLGALHVPVRPVIPEV